jgi:uncharacterized membrane protein
MRDLEVYAGAALLGTLAGMRSMAAPAVLGRLSHKGALAGVTGALAVVSKPQFGTVANVFAVVELVADKLPVAPNRTAAGPLLGRALTGGLSGAVICSARKRPAWAGGLIGAAAAVAAAYGAYEFRQRVGRNLHLPDAAIALAEDILVASLGVALASRLSASDNPLA